MRLLKNLVCVSTALLAFAVQSYAGDRYIVRTNPALINLVSKLFGLTVDKDLAHGGGVYRVTAQGNSNNVFQALLSTPLVQRVTKDTVVGLPELNGAFPKFNGQSLTYGKSSLSRNSCTQRAPGGLPAKETAAWYGYLCQTAVADINLPQAQQKGWLGSSGTTVAVIDTGVDANHAVLAGVIDRTHAYDFIVDRQRTYNVNQETVPFIDQETVPFIDQETVPFIDGAGSVVMVNQETVPFIDQETVPFIDQETVPFIDKAFLQKFPAVGHGTQVAGLVHLVAPNAKIMPLRAFGGDGSAALSDVLDAIYYAVDNGADVINMSFSATSDDTAELQDAINYAIAHGVICVASVSNANSTSDVFPAKYSIGVGATTLVGAPADFTDYNWGSAGDVDLAAPGVNIMSTYPGNHFAIASGTSFSTPLVAGTAALMRDRKSSERHADVDHDLKADPIPAAGVFKKKLGKGDLNVYNSVNAVK